MKRLAALGALALALFYAGASSAQTATRSSLNNFNNTFIIGNGRGAITGPVLNSSNNMIINNMGMLGDPNVWTGTQAFNAFISRLVSGSPAVSGTLGETIRYNNLGGNPAQGYGLVYFSTAGASNAPGFDVATTRLLINSSTTFPSGGAVGMATDWVISIGPTVTGNWGLGGEELDIVKRSQDDGLRTVRSTAPNPSNAFLAVPEANTFGNGGSTFNADWAFTTAHSSGIGAGGFQNKWYIGYYCAEDSNVGLLGYCNYAEGDNTSTASQYPYSPYGAGGTFLHGFDLTGATFIDGLSTRAAPGQGYGFVSTSFTAGMSSTGAGATLAPTFFADGGVQFQAGVTASANAPIVISGGITGTTNSSIVSTSTVGFNIQSGSSIFLGQAAFNMLSLTGTNSQLAAKSGNIIIGSGAVIASLSSVVGFVSIPFMNGAPTGVPTYVAQPSCIWNDNTFTLNCYSIGAAAWKHLTFSAGTG